MDYAEEDWIAKFQSLLEKFDEIPIASEQFVVFVGYLRVLFKKFSEDRKYS